jgi:hypothetical protein
VARNHQNEEVCNPGIHLNHKILISTSYFTGNQNGTTRQTDESWCSTARKGFAYHSVKLVLLSNGKRYEIYFNAFFAKWQSPLSIYNIALYQF